MTNPVPGHTITTPYGKRGPYWSCSKDSAGNGIHTGADFAAPAGTTVVAARPGTVHHTSYGSAFGSKQFAIRCDDGTEDFYAHTTTRPAAGTRVTAGQAIAKVGAEGNATGPHLHFERHKTQGRWACDVVTDPAPSINYQEDSVSNNYDYNYSGKPSGTLTVAQDYKRLDVPANWDPPRKGLEHVLVYLNCSGFVFTGNTPGRIRIRINRLDGDYTGYQDYTVVPGQTELLITHTYFEQGDGTTTAVDVKCLDGLRSMTVGTRYVKRAVLVD